MDAGRRSEGEIYEYVVGDITVLLCGVLHAMGRLMVLLYRVGGLRCVVRLWEENVCWGLKEVGRGRGGLHFVLFCGEKILV